MLTVATGNKRQNNKRNQHNCTNLLQTWLLLVFLFVVEMFDEKFDGDDDDDELDDGDDGSDDDETDEEDEVMLRYRL